MSQMASGVHDLPPRRERLGVSGHPRARAAGGILAALLALAALAGCTVPRPPGEGTIRYRDPVFTNVTVTRDLQYGSATSQAGATVALRLDLYQPAGDTQTKRPVLVWVHGGGYSGGDKASGIPPDIGNTFAKLGYVVASINYRLISTPCGGSSIPPACYAAAIDAQHDAQAAVRWLRANAGRYRLDATRIGIGGESAGAITAVLTGIHSEDPGNSGNPGFPSTVGAFVSISGGVPNAVFAGPGDPPGLLFHGDRDAIVPVQWSVDTAIALLRANVAAFLQVQRGAGHVPYGQYRDLFLQQTNYFLYAMLDLAHANGQPAAAGRAFDRQLQRLRGEYRRFEPGLRQLRRGYARFGH
jgi:dienelactone hydrolase